MINEPKVVLIEYGDLSGDGHSRTANFFVKTNLTEEEMDECNKKCFEVFGKYLWDVHSIDNPTPREDIIFEEYEDFYMPKSFIDSLVSRGVDIVKDLFTKYDKDELKKDGRVFCDIETYNYLIIKCISLMAKQFISQDAIFEEDKSLERRCFYGGYGLFG